ncbi:MAG: hypothetical protein AAFO58_10745 [Pseudomonadota bacterium]
MEKNRQSDAAKPSQAPPTAKSREDRLKAALKANIAKRKAQAKKRAAQTKD